jgi:hypothetical protein
MLWEAFTFLLYITFANLALHSAQFLDILLLVDLIE